MSTETRVVRPYLGGQEFQQILDSCALRCADEIVSDASEVSVDLDEYLNFPFAILLEDVDWSIAKTGAAALDLDPSDVDLLVLTIAPRLRFVDVVFQKDLSATSEFPESVALDREVVRALHAPHGGTDIGIFFCLNREREAQPLHPWRKGTWLGKKEFKIRTDLSGSGFVPVRLTDEDRERFELPKETARFATLENADPFDREPASDSLKLYVDGDLLDRLSVASTTAVGKHVQRQLFIDAATAIVFAAQQRLYEEPELAKMHIDEFRGSFVHKLVEFVAGRGSDSASIDARHREFHRIRSAPAAFVAQIEARSGIKKDMLASFGDVR